MAITPLDIRKKTFAGQLRGFSPTEVKAFLQLIANEMEELRKERSLLAEKADELTARVETYQQTEKLLQETLVTAQKATGELREGAKHDAELILEKARVEAARVRTEHAARLEGLRKEIRDLEAQRANLVDEIAGVARTYLAMAERHQQASASDDKRDTAKHGGSKE